MRVIMLTGLILCCSLTYSIPNIDTINVHEVTLLSTRELKNCFISFVSYKGHTYLVKQKKDSKKIFAVVKDALAAYIAKILKIAQSVEIIPPHMEFPGKIFSWPATIHSIAPGTVAHKYGRIRLKQFWKPFMSQEERGLTRTTIRDMSRHITLAMIVALDTLIGNTDRHSSNLIYDVSTDSFCAIDMDDTFNKDLCAFDYKKLQQMIQEETGNSFSLQEIHGLCVYRDTLKKLLRGHTSQQIKAKFHYFAKKAGLIFVDKPCSERMKSKLAFYEEMIEQSWVSAQKLVELIDKIVINRQSASPFFHSIHR